MRLHFKGQIVKTRQTANFKIYVRPIAIYEILESASMYFLI